METLLSNGLFKVVRDDPSLTPFNHAIRNRFFRYIRKREEIEQAEGSLSNFALGYKKFGLHQTANGVLYREWAPGAEGLYLVCFR
jgi:1,4-alpha-glucan branching enzyme